MKRKRGAMILLVLSILFAFIPAAHAEGYDVVITKNADVTRDNINIAESTIDIPIKVSGYDDIYAFSIKMEYVEGAVVESIVIGDIFKDYGNAVLLNSIDNENGKAEFMQTLLGVENGVNGDGVLCTIRITFTKGEYDIVNSLGLEVKIANSVPEYEDAYVPSFKVIAENATEDPAATPTPTLEPVATASIGIVTPNPESETSQEFTAAEDEDVEEILEEINQMEEAQNATPEPTALPSSTDIVTDDTSASEAATDNDITTKSQGTNNNTNVMSIVLIIVLVILIGALVVIIIFRYRGKTEK